MQMHTFTYIFREPNNVVFHVLYNNDGYNVFTINQLTKFFTKHKYIDNICELSGLRIISNLLSFIVYRHSKLA